MVVMRGAMLAYSQWAQWFAPYFLSHHALQLVPAPHCGIVQVALRLYLASAAGTSATRVARYIEAECMFAMHADAVCPRSKIL